MAGLHKGRLRWLAPAMAMVIAGCAAASSSVVKENGDPASVEQGRYIITIGSCNDCHTDGYAESGGGTAESEWLKGSVVGWRGPWGTTYPPNLRNFINALTEDQWVAVAQSARYRPPMPWYSLQKVKPEDLKAVYRFVHALGPSGAEAPAYVSPGHEPKQPYILFPTPPTPPPGK